MAASSTSRRTGESSFTWRGLALVTGLSLAIRLLLMVARTYSGNADFGSVGGDAGWWLDLANSLYHLRDLSAWQLGARPPLFAISVAVVQALGGGKDQALLLQTLFGAATPTLGYLLAGRLLSRVEGLPNRMGLTLLAGVVMALDPASISISPMLMAEPLFNLLFTACLLHLTIYIQGEDWRHLALSALWLALSMWTRNTSIYFWVMTPVILFLLMRRWWQPSLVLAGVGLAVYLAWSARNLAYTGVFTYSLQTNFQLLFVRAVSAEHLTTGAPVQTLYVDYVRELYRRAGDFQSANGPLPNKPYWDFLVAKTPQLYAAMGQLAVEKLSQYWLFALLGTGVGLLRMFVRSHQLPSWVTPVEVVYHVLLYGLTGIGGWMAWARRERQLLALTGIPILYVTALTMISQVSALDTRMSTPIRIPIIILAAAGLGWAWPRLRQRIAPRRAASA
jgi:Dolichyl-phosphate-mannose-protein mannosyltransferase